jgi:hypothetical protein
MKLIPLEGELQKFICSMRTQCLTSSDGHKERDCWYDTKWLLNARKRFVRSSSIPYNLRPPFSGVFEGSSLKFLMCELNSRAVYQLQEMGSMCKKNCSHRLGTSEQTHKFLKVKSAKRGPFPGCCVVQVWQVQLYVPLLLQTLENLKERMRSAVVNVHRELLKSILQETYYRSHAATNEAYV